MNNILTQKVTFLLLYHLQLYCIEMSSLGYSKCQKTRMEALGTHTLDEKPEKPVPPGRFVPQCANDGSFDEVQCYGSTGYCWCVDSDGIPVLGTMTRGLPYCNKTMLGGDNLSWLLP